MQPSGDDAPSPYWLRPSDQAVISAVLLVALILMAAVWLSRGGLSGDLQDIDELPQRQFQFQVDINTADWPELALLPNVGETLARRIVESREAEGPFRTFDDLDRVRGIGPKTLERMLPYLRPIDNGQTIE